MSKLTEILSKIHRKWTKIRLRPVRVFCMHHVSDVYDPKTMWECDWVNTDVLKQWIEAMQQQGYQFISLPEAHMHLQSDFIRCHKYAALTADDGFYSMLNILPWLEEQQIPITLFVNPKYIFEDAIGPNVQDKFNESHGTAASDTIYLKKADVIKLQSPYVTLAHHGYEHYDSRKIDAELFTKNIDACVESMRIFAPYVIPYYAYPFGHYSRKYDSIIREQGLTPLYVSGGENYDNSQFLDRELISNENISKRIC